MLALNPCDNRTMVETTEWRSIPGFDGYRVSSAGTVRSVRKVLRSRIHKSGYAVVSMMKDGKSHLKSVHRLVLLAFVGEPPKGTVGCHKDGNRLNNRVWNLRWDTPEANQADSVMHGTKAAPPIRRGEAVVGSKLTAEKVRLIRTADGPKGLNAKLATEYGVSQMVISKIRRRLIWRHVQ
jgi:hypothetical protein